MLTIWLNWTAIGGYRQLCDKWD